MKKVISLLLTVVMVFSFMALVFVPAQAYAQATTFTPRTTSPGSTGYFSNYTRNNCTAYAACRANEILGSNVFPNGNSAIGVDNFDDYGFPTGSTPKIGAIAVWSGKHVAIVEAVNGSTITTSEGHYEFQPTSAEKYNDFKNVDYNGDGVTDAKKSSSNKTGTYFDIHVGSMNYVSGSPNVYIYLVADGTSSNPINPQIISDKNVLTTGENVTFTYSGLTICTQAKFFFEKNGEVYYSEDSTSSRTMTTYFENEGSYCVFAGGYYNGQWYYSDKLSIYVYNPKISVSKTSVVPYEEFTVSYDGMTYCNSVSFYVYKNGSYYNQYDSTSSKTMSICFAEEGTYTFKAVGSTGSGTVESSTINVVVAAQAACSHSYTSKITKEATCTETGIRTYTCSKCGDSYTKTIAALGHSYTTKVVAPTCTKQGYTLHKCSRCGDSYKDTYVAALGHDDGEWVVTKEATYDEAGSKELRCTKCGKVLDTEVIPKLIRNGWVTVDGKKYYYKNDVMQTGWQTITNAKGVAYKYYFGADGAMYTGWHKAWNNPEKTGTPFYLYFGDNGVMRTGWQNITNSKGNTYKYYFGTDGKMRTGWQKITNSKGKTYRYHFQSNGVLDTGWKKITNSKGVTYQYHFQSNGVMDTGWKSITNSKGKTYKYYFKENGVMLTGWQWITNSKGVKYRYYFGPKGDMKTGWQSIKNAKGVAYKYYFGTNGVMVTGWQNIKASNGKTYKYYFGTNGYMRTGWQWIANSKGVKYRYYFGPNGWMRTGWQNIKASNGKTYKYYFYSNGVNVINKSVKIGTKTYKFNKYGICTNY